MIKKGLYLLILVLGSTIVTAQSLTRNIATVNYIKTEVITEQEYNNALGAMEAQMGRSLSNDERKELLDSLINSVILLQEATKEKVTITNDELLRGLQAMFQQPRATLADLEKIYNSSPGAKIQSWNQFIDEVKKQGAKEKYLGGKIVPPMPSDAEIEKAYNDNKQNFVMPRTARVSHIFFNFKELSDADKKTALERANAALRQLQSGATTFEQLVRTASEDTESSRRLGDIGYILDNDSYREVLGSPFVNEVFRLKAGQTSNVVASLEGYHILRITETDPEKLMKLSDMNPGNPQQTIKQMVMMQLQTRYFQTETLALIDRLRKNAKIEINEANWTPWARGTKNPS